MIIFSDEPSKSIAIKGISSRLSKALLRITDKPSSFSATKLSRV
ncbi:22155_t:CDS:1, partial [Racocetra persica]